VAHRVKKSPHPNVDNPVTLGVGEHQDRRRHRVLTPFSWVRHANLLRSLIVEKAAFQLRLPGVLQCVVCRTALYISVPCTVK
jgi:hypothetical protein